MNATADAIACVDIGQYVTEPDGRPLPQSSAPAIIEALLRLADIKPGHRVCEIGTGSGLSTKYAANLTGPTGAVVSIEVDPAVAERATAKLADTPQATVLHGDGGQGAPDAAPFDRLIAWTTPSVIPATWVRQMRDGGVIVTPVKVAPVAMANLTVRATVNGGQPNGVELHEGSFVDLTPTAADQRVPAFYLDATADTGGDVPAWMSAPAVRDDHAAATRLLDGLMNRATSTPAKAVPFPVLVAALAAARPHELATVYTGRTRGIGYATPNSIAIATPDGILSHGTNQARDALAVNLPTAETTLAPYIATTTRGGDGWGVAVTNRRQLEPAPAAQPRPRCSTSSPADSRTDWLSQTARCRVRRC